MTRRDRHLKVVRSDVLDADAVQNVPGNHYDKHGSTNPLVQRMMRSFHDRLIELGDGVPHGSVLDVGCGEGRTTSILDSALRPELTVACDLEVSAVSQGPATAPGVQFLAASVYELPFDADAFDLVVATEVFEHLDNPTKALIELQRVARAAMLITVPNEPWWRMGNMARGAYLRDLGNTPGHVQHWTTQGLRRFMSGHFATAHVTTAAMWNIALVRL